MGRILGVCAAGSFLLWLATCGGKAIVDGSGGSSNNSSSSRASATTNAGTTGPGPSSGTATASGGAAPGVNCTDVCTDLFQCGLQSDGMGQQLCQGFSPENLQEFLEGDPGVPDDGCIATCETNPALASIVDPSDCPGTITTLKPLSADFQCICDMGFGPPCTMP